MKRMTAVLAMALVAAACARPGPHRLDRAGGDGPTAEVAAPVAAGADARASGTAPTPLEVATSAPTGASSLSPPQAADATLSFLAFPPARDEVVARVQGEELRKSQVYEHLLATWPDKVQAAIAVLVGNRVLAAEAARAGIAVPEAEIESWWLAHRQELEKRVRVEYGPDTTPATWFRDVLGQTEEDYRRAVCDRERAKRLLGRVIRFNALREERVLLRIISVEDADLARRLLTFASEGADFAGLAKKFSTHPTASQGGAMTPVPRGVLSSELDAVAFRLAEGQVSDAIPVTDRDGRRRWQIIQIVRRLPGRDVRWPEVEEEVVRSLEERPLEQDEWYIWQVRVDRRVETPGAGRPR